MLKCWRICSGGSLPKMLDFKTLLSILPTLPVQSIEEVCFRAVNLEKLYGFHNQVKYSLRPLYPFGSPVTGARFTPVGGMASLYLAADPETAFAEANQIYTKTRKLNPLTFQPPPPTVIFGVQVKVEQVVDLTDTSIQSALQTSANEIKRHWRRSAGSGLPPTQQLGQAAFDCGTIQALRYASAQRPGGICYAIFTERLTGNTSFVEVYDPDNNLLERLP